MTFFPIGRIVDDRNGIDSYCNHYLWYETVHCERCIDQDQRAAKVTRKPETNHGKVFVAMYCFLISRNHSYCTWNQSTLCILTIISRDLLIIA